MKKSQISCAIWPWSIRTKEGFEAVLKDVTDIGYRHFESTRGLLNVFELNSAEIGEIIKRNNIEVDSFYYHLPSKGNEGDVFDNLERELEAIADLNVKRLTLQGVYGRPEGEMDEKERQHNLNLMNKFANIAKTFGLATNVHPHVGTYFMYEDEIDYVMQNSDPNLIYFAPDTAHIAAADADPVEVIRRYADRVNFTHFKDYKLGNEVVYGGWVDSDVPIMECFHGLGDGNVDFPEVIKILDSVNYTGPLCTELDQTPTTNKDSAQKNYNYLCKYLED